MQRHDSAGDNGSSSFDLGLESSSPPTPWGSLYPYQRKELSKKAVCKPWKIKGRFAQEARIDAL
jgi:hypothetical protein